MAREDLSQKYYHIWEALSGIWHAEKSECALEHTSTAMKVASCDNAMNQSFGSFVTGYVKKEPKPYLLLQMTAGGKIPTAINNICTSLP